MGIKTKNSQLRESLVTGNRTVLYCLRLNKLSTVYHTLIHGSKFKPNGKTRSLTENSPHILRNENVKRRRPGKMQWLPGLCLEALTGKTIDILPRFLTGQKSWHVLCFWQIGIKRSQRLSLKSECIPNNTDLSGRV